MRIYAIADLHLSSNGEKPMDIYGGQWIGHTKKIKKNWEALVEADDVVLIAGDSSWAMKQEEAIPDLDWIAELPGKKVLIKGNHDLWWTSVSKLNMHSIRICIFYRTPITRLASLLFAEAVAGSVPAIPNLPNMTKKYMNANWAACGCHFPRRKTREKKRIIGMLHYPRRQMMVWRTPGFTSIFEEFNVEIGRLRTSCMVQIRTCGDCRERETESSIG